MKEWLGASMTQVGILVAIGSFGPIFELAGAQIVERMGRRKPLYITFFMISKVSLIFVALIPFLGRSPQALTAGLAIVYSVTIITRITSHLVNPALISWWGDLIPENYRGRFFGQRMQWGMAGMILYLVGSILIDRFGGMKSPVLIACVVGIGTIFAIIEAVMFMWVPEPKMFKGKLEHTIGEVVTWVFKPFQRSDFRMLVLCLGVTSFAGLAGIANSPYIAMYLRGSDVAGHKVGFDASFTYLSFVVLAFSMGCALSGKYWGTLGDRIRPQYVLCIGLLQVVPSGVLFFINASNYHVPIIIASFINGLLFSAFIVGQQHLIYEVTPKQYRSFYLASNSMGLALIGAICMYIAGYISDLYPVMSWRLPGGQQFTYVHLLLLLAYGSSILSIFLAWMIKPHGQDTDPIQVEQETDTTVKNVDTQPHSISA